MCTVSKEGNSLLFNRDPENLVKRSWYADIIEEMKVKCPDLFKVLLCAIGEKIPVTSQMATVATIYGMLVHCRNPKASALQRLYTILAIRYHADNKREDVLLNEMDATGQAFEDMQEQNTRLLQQLREKDDANFKLMSERIKANQIQKLLREEKEVLAEQVSTIHTQVEAQILVVRKLEEKERVLQSNIATMEKELALTQQTLELHKRKAVESSQTAADLKLHLDKYQAQLREAQVAVAEKTGAIEQEAYKYKRMQEEIAKLNRKLERSKKIEMAGGADEVLMAEIQEYKEQLTCPSCKVNRKDAVLTKCFHVFCLECLKTRYETRQRKCPKCNAGFGANDYHRLYLT